MNTEELLLLLADTDQSKIVTKLKLGRPTALPDEKIAKDQLDPLEHKVFNKLYRPDKKVKIDTEDINQNIQTVASYEGAKVETGFYYEPVARIALAIQKLIVKRAVSFIFGNPVSLNADVEKGSAGQQSVLKALKRVLYDVKERSFNRKIARNLFSCTEVAEVWYPVEKQTKAYGFDSKFKLRCGIFSPLLGDKLYPYFDETGDMIAFSREFTVTDTNSVKTNFFETYTDTQHLLWNMSGDTMNLVEGYPKIVSIGKIPVIYGSQPQVEWEDVQGLIERLEKLLSNFADTNDYHAAPKIFTTGEILGFAKKGESGAIIEGEQGSTAQYLSWQNAPESVKLEIDTLLRMIYTITQTPDISFDAVKGIGAISGIALKLLFMDAHLKVVDHQEVFDDYLQRRINVIKAFIGKFNTKLAGDAEDLQVEPEITPYIIRDEAAEVKIWQDANGGNPVMSQRASFVKANMTASPEEDYDQYLIEQEASTARTNSFVIGEPTLSA